MRKSRRIRIISRSEQTLTIKTKPAAATAKWCAECSALVRMLTPDEAAALSSRTPRIIYRWIEGGLLHYTESASNELLICFNALLLLMGAERF